MGSPSGTVAGLASEESKAHGVWQARVHGALRREAEVGEEAAERGEVDPEGEDARRRTAAGAEQWIDLVPFRH